MSSFAGVFRLDGALLAASTVEAMLGRLAHRVTPDGAARARVRVSGGVGLGCAVLPTTPQARLELEDPDAHQVVREGGAELWIVSDARLDNRDELIGALGAQSQARGWSDGRLILASYARWGPECAARLRGDFGFAIWDGRQKRLFCARDVWGNRPFYYALVPGQLFAFASEVKALWCAPELDASVNPVQVAGYLAGRFEDKTSTFYRDARRLTPACWLVLSPGTTEVSEHTYWKIDEQSELNLEGDARARDEGYARLVREALESSVRQRMRCDTGLAAFLSGGLDSSSIAALAERALDAGQKPLTTLSTIFERFPQCDERAYMKQTLARGEFHPLWMNGDAISPFAELERIVWHLDGPSPGPNICSSWAQYRVLQNAGVSVVLDGHGGDEIVFMGYVRVGELLQQGRLARAWNEMRLLRRHGLLDVSPTAQVWSTLLWRAQNKRGWGRLTRPWASRAARRDRERAAHIDSTRHLNETSLDILTPECRAQLPEPVPEAPAYGLRDHHAQAIQDALQPLALEGIDAVGGAHAIETRCPFWERELAQLCLSLPSDLKLRHGHNRYVMRRAMQGILAPGVQWRRNKTNFGQQITTLLREEEGTRLDGFFEQWEAATSGLGDYVDLARARALWQTLGEAPPDSEQSAIAAITLWKIFGLGLWLGAQSSHSKATPRR